MIDKCETCGSTDNDGWLLETVIDYRTNLVSSREAPCPACEKRVAGKPTPVPEPIPGHDPEQVTVRAVEPEAAPIPAQAAEPESERVQNFVS